MTSELDVPGPETPPPPPGYSRKPTVLHCIDYVGIYSGQVAAESENHIALSIGCGLKLFEKKDGHVYHTRRDALFALAREKQTRGMKLLEQANALLDKAREEESE